MKKIVLLLYMMSAYFTISSDPIRILVGSPVHQKPAILKEFLDSLTRLNSDNIRYDYCFYDDNVDPLSKELLATFSDRVDGEVIIFSGSPENYLCTEHTHYWTNSLVWKVAAYKDAIINCAAENDYDYLFLIDSDIVLHPNTIHQLISDEKDIVSNIFWTQWAPNDLEAPQVWLYDTYYQAELADGERKLSPEEYEIRRVAFYEKLRMPGVYEVGGLGACTLISKHSLQTGISFSKIKNIRFWGEDRHFCVRAAAKGLSLWVDTHYPSLHLYRESELVKVEDFIASCKE